ncbi:oxygen-dependent protoporphyrinogen oxidase [Evansella caseinilytica]|uniref:Coproporphyrinogen III oxidase n=1 Tax=Evansella caseinilytica TaxID=1503961 RepID=A0A1H3K2Y3_9BACI|nr:protoporphyrinogen oxidase [Evansella caseinilytica]SDY46580.1 oxygen-dependent protoporphyrinogen oxidase [Evansella caseinilytica]
MNSKRIAVVGGGLTGLSAAYYLQKEIGEKGLDMEFTLYEASARLGGKIKTDYTDGFVIELGPDSFLARKQSASILAKEVGLGSTLVHNSSGQSYILHEGKLYPMPGGAIMGIPTQWGPFLKTRLFTPLGKIRAAGDLFFPKTMKDGKDVSLGTFFRSRLGNEVVDRLIEPLLSGIYAGDIDKLSLQATFPHFQQLEEKYRSLILGMKSNIAKQQSGAQPAQKKGKGKGMFLSLTGGLQSLVDGVENKLEKGVVQKNKQLVEVTKNGSSYRLRFDDGDVDEADCLIFATPHHVTYRLLKQYSFAEFLHQIPSTSVATVALAYRHDALKKDIDGSGFVVSKKSKYSITACTWTHRKWAHSSPEGYALLRGYVGRAGDEAIVEKSDDEIVSAVLKDLNQMMEIDGQPQFYRITRWKKSMPQYEVGHLDSLKRVYEGVGRELPGVFLTGASYGGIGLPDCIDQGKRTAEKVIHHLGE